MSAESPPTLVGRQTQIHQFEWLTGGDSRQWAMLVDGLSGTGKRELLAWLHKHRTDGIASARIQLTPHGDRGDRLLQQMVSQLDPALGASFAQTIAEQASEERRQPLVNYAPNYTLHMQARWGGVISEANQAAAPVLELGPEYLSMIEDSRRTRRLDLLERTLLPLAGRTWVLFVSDAEHLDIPSVRTWLLDDVVPRLRQSHPGFRLYLTGSTVPHAAFAADERIDATLEPLTRSDALKLLRDSGLDAESAERGFELTLGHPLLMRLFLHGRAGAGVGALSAPARGQVLDEGARTRWIYDSVLAGIGDERLRAMAEDLALLEWFDVGLLRSAFDAPLADRDFDELARRSFLKALPNGRWRCHDVIRKHLRPRLLARDPSHVMTLQRRLFAALTARLALGAERSGGLAFPERLDLAVAAVHSAADCSVPEAEAFALSELAVGFAELESDYVFAFADALTRSGTHETLATLGRDAKEALELLGALKWSDTANKVIDRLATHALTSGQPAAGATLLGFAGLINGHTGHYEASIAYAQRAATASDSLDARIQVARALTRAGRTDDAAAALADARAVFGDSAVLRVAEGNLARANGDTEEAARRYSGAIAAFPEAATDARLQLAQILSEQRDAQAALVHVDAVLEHDPTHREATSMRLGLLAVLGRVDDFLNSVGRVRDQDLGAVDLYRAMTVALADSRSRGRLLTMLELDPDSVSMPMVFALCDVLANEGDVDRVMKLTHAFEQRYPRTRHLCDMRRASALIAVGRNDDAIAMLQPLFDIGVAIPDAYFMLAGCYQRGGDAERARQVLQHVSATWRAFKDPVDAQIASSMLAEGRKESALAYLAAEQRAPLGPMCRSIQAQIIAADDPDRALRLLEEIIHTSGRADMVLGFMIATRRAYGLLLAARGRSDDAAAVAQALAEHFGAEDPDAIIGASLIYGVIGDEQSLRRLLTECADADPRARSAILEQLIRRIVNRNPSPDDLLRAIEAEPDRIDLIAAALVLLGIRGDRDAVARGTALIQRVAPAALAAYIEMTTMAIGLASPGELAPLASAAQQGQSPYLSIGIIRTLGQSRKMPLDVARKTLQQLAAASPQHADDAAAAEAQMLLALNQIDDASLVLAPYVDRDEAPEPVLLATYSVHMARKDFSAAERVIRRAIDRFPDHRRELHEALADVMNLAERYAEALAVLAEIERDGPLDDGQLLSRAGALAGLDRRDEALEAVRQAEQLPNLPPPRRGKLVQRRAALLRAAGRLDESVAAFTEAISLMPRDGRVRIGLAKTLQKAERWAESYEAMLDGVALSPSHMSDCEADLRALHARVVDSGSQSAAAV